MLVHGWVNTLISLMLQNGLSVKPTKNTPHLIPLGTKTSRSLSCGVTKFDSTVVN
ncbi:hypothetical protein MXB_1555 [Myxobolus squamalis]|nr:hypothetical protein MXB_1555 [Myxobolus squamalis]